MYVCVCVYVWAAIRYVLELELVCKVLAVCLAKSSSLFRLLMSIIITFFDSLRIHRTKRFGSGIHTFMHTHIYTYTHTYIQYMHIIPTNLHTYTHTHIYIHTNTYIHIYKYIFIHTYIHTALLLFISGQYYI